jgi:hypothetical protein
MTFKQFLATFRLQTLGAVNKARRPHDRSTATFGFFAVGHFLLVMLSGCAPSGRSQLRSGGRS